MGTQPLQPLLILLSGRRGAGKTAFCRRLAQQARALGLRLAGLVSPAEFRNGEKIAIHVMDLVSSERRLLARPNTRRDFGPYATSAWEFLPETVAWANELLAQIGDCDLLIIDELGPLELEQGGGWQAALDVIQARRYFIAVVVIRPELLAAAQARWPEAHTLLLQG